jgi:hypothetical protein
VSQVKTQRTWVAWLLIFTGVLCVLMANTRVGRQVNSGFAQTGWEIRFLLRGWHAEASGCAEFRFERVDVRLEAASDGCVRGRVVGVEAGALERVVGIHGLHQGCNAIVAVGGMLHHVVVEHHLVEE